MNKVYIILILLDHGKMQEITNVSQEGYSKLEDAQKFCMERENGAIIKISNMVYAGQHYIYKIKEISIK